MPYKVTTWVIFSIVRSTDKTPAQLRRISFKRLQVCKTRTCVRTYDGWPNKFASRLASSRKLQKVVNFTHIQLTCDQLVSTCVGWPNGETCIDLHAHEFELDRSQRKWVAKRNANWTRVKNLRLARALYLILLSTLYYLIIIVQNQIYFLFELTVYLY